MLNLKKKIIMSAVTLSLATALVGGATFALFGDETVNANNTFAAGTVDIVLNSEADDETTPVFTLTDIAPGDSGATILNVDNAGSLEFRYDVSVDVDGALFGGDYPIVLTLKDSSGTQLWTGSADQTVDLNRVLASGSNENLTLEWSFSKDAENDYQGVAGNFSLNFTSEQTKNN